MKVLESSFFINLGYIKINIENKDEIMTFKTNLM